MSPTLYLACTCLIAVLVWLVLAAAWGKDLNPFIRAGITLMAALIWPLALLGLLVIGVLILINKPKNP